MGGFLEEMLSKLGSGRAGVCLVREAVKGTAGRGSAQAKVLGSTHARAVANRRHWIGIVSLRVMGIEDDGENRR